MVVVKLNEVYPLFGHGVESNADEVGVTHHECYVHLAKLVMHAPLCFTLAYALEISIKADCDVEVVGESCVFVDFFMAWDLCNIKMVAQHHIQPFNGKNFFVRHVRMRTSCCRIQ